MNYGKAKYALILLIFASLFFLLSRVFSGQIILPQYFSIGPLTIHYYGIVMALAVAAAFFVAIKRASKYDIDPKRAEDIIFWLIIGGFVGARAYHVLSHFSYYAFYPSEILKVWNGGLSIFGAILGGLLTLWILQLLSTKHLALSTLLDWLTPSLILGQIIGRFGNLFNYEAFGYPTNLPWKMFVPPQFRPEQYQTFSFFHPFFLYEAAGNLVILIFLLWIGSRTRRPNSENQNPWPSVRDFAATTPDLSESKGFASGGSLFFSYLLLYNTLRFVLEFIRTDSTFIYGFRLNAYVALPMAVCSALVLLWIKRYGKKT